MKLLPWLLLWLTVCSCRHAEYTDEMMLRYRNKVRKMFYHAYNGYLDHAYPKDELKPIACEGVDTWGSFSLSLVDSLDTLLIMGNHTEFKRAVQLVLESVKTDANVNVSVFETNIRVVGGLLTAHMLSGRVPDMELEEGWPCSGPLLRLAEKMAARLLPAFNTETGMPFGTVNLKYGVHKKETPITCTASIGTFILEFGSLSALTGDKQYEQVALKALDALWNTRSRIGLLGNHINVQTGQWTATDAGIGAGVDSYFEYLVKGAILFQKPKLMEQFKEHLQHINKHIRKEDWFMWVNMQKATVSLPIFQSLEAFWPGILTLTGDIEDASRIMLQYSKVIRSYGFPPEFYNIAEGEPTDKRAAFPLRPEMAESLMYLYRATDDPIWLDLGAQMIDAIEESAKTKCGYATVNNVRDHSIEDRMESFFLAETTKYLYLLFDPDNFIHNDGKHAKVIDTPNGHCVIESGGYIFNTEAHPIDPAILACCSTRKEQEMESKKNWSKNINFKPLVRKRSKKPKKYMKPAKQPNRLSKPEDNKEDAPLLPQFNPSPETVGMLAKEPVEVKKTGIEREEVVNEVRGLIKKARLMDESNAENGKTTNLAEHLIENLRKLYADFEVDIVKAMELEDMSAEELKRKIEKRALVAQIPVVEAICQNCCYPLEFVGEDILERIWTNLIFKNYIYPHNKITFEYGPVCRLWETPRVEDSYMNVPPAHHEEEDPNEVPLRLFAVSQSLQHFDFGDFSKYNFQILGTPPQTFKEKFTGLGHITLRKNHTAL